MWQNIKVKSLSHRGLNINFYNKRLKNNCKKPIWTVLKEYIQEFFKGIGWHFWKIAYSLSCWELDGKIDITLVCTVNKKLGTLIKLSVIYFGTVIIVKAFGKIYVLMWNTESIILSLSNGKMIWFGFTDHTGNDDDIFYLINYIIMMAKLILINVHFQIINLFSALASKITNDMVIVAHSGNRKAMKLYWVCLFFSVFM